MVKYFRPATGDDFKGHDVQFDHYRYMGDDIKKLIEEDRLREAMNKLRKETSMGLVQIKSYCDEYQKYLTAKKDFENGKPVFVPY